MYATTEAYQDMVAAEVREKTPQSFVDCQHFQAVDVPGRMPGLPQTSRKRPSMTAPKLVYSSGHGDLGRNVGHSDESPGLGEHGTRQDFWEQRDKDTKLQYILLKTNTKEMNNYTVNFTTPVESTNSTTESFWLLDHLRICTFSINLLFGFPTHSYIIWLIITGTGSGVALEFFILNLSVCELGICLNSLISALSFSFFSLSTFRSFSLGLVTTGRPVFQCLICVERYLAVVYPVIFLKYKPLRYRVICCTAAWITILGSCFCYLFIDTKTGQIHKQFFSLQFLLALCIQLFCVVAVLRALKQSGPGERRREREEENHMKRRAFQIILITTISMTIIYVPFATVGLFTILTNHYIHKLWITGLICYVLAGFVQPVLFLHRTGKLSCSCAP
ncbi:uncharacterized protein LOC143715703 [Siphateles boraxobius]|uniref:uncharacterized protein LOC143715703 n=1 Tax=Siphateles boraxobius TaxID=180520 RepID=UPI004062BF9B